jgi:hypothetical protein
LGYFKIIGGLYPVLSLTPKGETALAQKESILLKLPSRVPPESIQRKKEELKAGGTVEYTASLFANGLKPEQIAQERGMAVTTIYGHLAQLIETGKIRLEQVVPADIIQKVRDAIRSVGSTQYLAPINQFLRYEVDYNIIRCVVAGLRPEISKNDIEKTDSIESFLSHSHPRPLTGPWQMGWALGFHSRFSGGDWSRTEIGDLAYRLKYQSDATAVPMLVRQALELFATHPEMTAINAILPVPPTLQREFEPVYVFAEALARQTGKPLLAALSKNRTTQPQKEMTTLAQKRANVKGAFALQAPVRNLCLLVIDDLFDSGATLEEITQLLQRAGAARVNVLALTRTIHSDA